MALQVYLKERVGKLIFREWSKRPEIQEKCQSMNVTPFALWNYHGGKDEEAKKYDVQHKEEEMERIKLTIKNSEQIYANLQETF